YQKNGFNFKQYGVRVPAIIISSWIPQNMIDQRIYDHTSILATLERLFEVPPLTERDRHANDLLDLLTLDSPRNTPVILEDPADSQAPSIPDNVKDESIDPSIVGFVHIASMRDYEVSPPAERHGVPAKAASIETRSDALDYLKEVKARVQ
ncbi:MAG TPA: alkaline phosphatase family protein, partial [Flavisolibacter sp.]|nr:alkaline phosphatase family protein [Flavisolibacter sp.]